MDKDLNYRIITIPLNDDYEGRTVATLLSKKTSGESRGAVLYIHGFIDYFFQDHLADAFLRAGFDFYALELRKYGRSLLPHQHPNYARSVFEYFEEIDKSVENIQNEGHAKITFLGHSTGGLIASLYASAGKCRNCISALMLNSPFFEFNVSKLVKYSALMALPIVHLWPYAKLEGILSPLYAESVHKDYKGEWNFNTEWKPIEGFPTYLYWIKAIWQAHRILHRGLNVGCPVLVMHSDRSSWPKRKWYEDIRITDTVLNVGHIKKYAKCVGSDVEDFEVVGGMHDLVLSRKDIREKVLSKMVEWATNHAK